MAAGRTRIPEKGGEDRTLLTHGSLEPATGVPVALENLGRSRDPAPALAAALSALTFLEREGWPQLPGRDSWALGEGGYPCVLPDGSPSESPEACLRGCLQAFQSATGTLRRTSDRRSTVASMLARASDAEGLLPGPGELLRISLAEGGGRAFASLPETYCMGFVWKVEAEIRPGLHRWRADSPSGPQGRGLRAALCGVSAPARPWRWVGIGECSPYPFGTLEPVVRAALPRGEDPARWIVDRLGERDGDGLPDALKGLLGDSGSGGFLVGPEEALDPSSRKLLERVGPDLPLPLALLGGAGGPPPITLIRVRFPGLTLLAESWFCEHLGALFGPSPDAWLPSLAMLGGGLPRCGASLLPPVPAGTPHPHRIHLGADRGGPEEVPPRQKPGRWVRDGARKDADLSAVASRGELAALAVQAANTPDPALRRYWEGMALLLVGQPALALACWEGLEREIPSLAGTLGVQRARAFERTHAFPRVLAELERVDPADLGASDRPWHALYRGHILDLTGHAEEAGEILRRLSSSGGGADLRAQALCHLASASLRADDPERAMGLLAEAEAAGRDAEEPLTRFLVLHRSGLALKAAGEYVRALERLSAATALAAHHGFRHLEAGGACDVGNCLRMVGRFPEAAEAYRRAEEGGCGLGLTALVEAARFDRAICLLEGGEILGAQAVFAEFAARPAPTAHDAAIHAYWLALALRRRCDPPAALEWAERGLRRLEGLADAEVRLPLLLLRGELLLLSGQARKAQGCIAEVEGSLGPSSEADDALHACALRAWATASGEGPPLPCEVRAADVEAGASPEVRSLWLIARAHLRPRRKAQLLPEALQAARGAPGPHALCEVLAAMHRHSLFPRLGQGEAGRIAEYIRRNRIAGPLRDLLPLLAPSENERTPPPPKATPGAIHILGRWASGDSAALGWAADHLGASGAFCFRPGSVPLWAGKWTAEGKGRIASLLADGGTRTLREEGLLLAGEVPGPVCGFVRCEGGRPWGEESWALADLLLRLAPAGPPSAEVRPARRDPVHPAVEALLVTRSEGLRPVLESLTRAASFRYPVLLTGEPGVGKEACARALHGAWGPRKPFLPFNCANLTPTLASSQLFGHRRGAFTGADRDQAGLVESARGGILFLDEVGELPGETQAQLLRFLQDGSYLPLGETHGRSSDARVVAATNRDLESMVASGTFRADLFHRLNVIRIEVPPLRAHAEDIEPLFRKFLAEAARESGIEIPAVEESVVARLRTHAWPGNVRELQNLAKALLVASHGERTVRAEHLPPRMRELSGDGPRPGGGTPYATRMEAAERRLIEEALRECGGNITRAAKSMGVSRQTLSQKLKRLGVSSR